MGFLYLAINSEIVDALVSSDEALLLAKKMTPTTTRMAIIAIIAKTNHVEKGTDIFSWIRNLEGYRRLRNEIHREKGRGGTRKRYTEIKIPLLVGL